MQASAGRDAAACIHRRDDGIGWHRRPLAPCTGCLVWCAPRRLDAPGNASTVQPIGFRLGKQRWRHGVAAPIQDEVAIPLAVSPVDEWAAVACARLVYSLQILLKIRAVCEHASLEHPRLSKNTPSVRGSSGIDPGFQRKHRITCFSRRAGLKFAPQRCVLCRFSEPALQPPPLTESRKINAGRRVPSRRAIAGAKLHRDILVAIRNPQWRPGYRIWLGRTDSVASAPALRFRDLFVVAVD